MIRGVFGNSPQTPRITLKKTPIIAPKSDVLSMEEWKIKNPEPKKPVLPINPTAIEKSNYDSFLRDYARKHASWEQQQKVHKKRLNDEKKNVTRKNNSFIPIVSSTPNERSGRKDGVLDNSTGLVIEEETPKSDFYDTDGTTPDPDLKYSTPPGSARSSASESYFTPAEGNPNTPRMDKSAPKEDITTTASLTKTPSTEEADRLAVEAAEKAEADRLAAEAAEADRLAAEAAEQAEADRLAAEAAEADRLAAEKAEADRLAAEAAEKAEADRLAVEAAEADRLAAEKAEADRLAAEQEEADRLAAEAAEQAEADRLAVEAAEQAEADRIAAEAAEQAEADRLEAEAAEQAEADRLEAEAAEQAEADRLEAEAAEQAEADRLAAEKAEADRLAAERQGLQKEEDIQKRTENAINLQGLAQGISSDSLVNAVNGINNASISGFVGSTIKSATDNVSKICIYKSTFTIENDNLTIKGDPIAIELKNLDNILLSYTPEYSSNQTECILLEAFIGDERNPIRDFTKKLELNGDMFNTLYFIKTPITSDQ